MDKNEQLIMVVDREKLFKDFYFNGFCDYTQFNFEKIILSNYYFIKRGLAEKDPTKKQPIAYTIVVKNKKIFVYQRPQSSKEHTDERLQHMFSWGIGGHIDKSDESDNPIINSLNRELKEEIGLEGKPKVIGYINDDTNEIGQVHFGILYMLETKKDVKPTSEELKTGNFMSLNEIEKLIKSGEKIETWSTISLSALKQILS